jgi:hypothetical protein
MKFSNSIIFFLAMMQTGLSQPPVSKKQFHLYLLAGQSNMAGRGDVEKGDTTPNTRVWVLNQKNQWQVAIEPLHFDKPGITGVGPGLAFARRMAEQDTNIVIGLIPCAVGGSPIDAWQPGKYYEPTKSYPYDDAIKRTTIAMQQGILKGVLWHQGESDSDSLHATLYAEHLTRLVNRIRTEVRMKSLPFVAGTLAEFYTADHPFANEINKTIEQLPSKLGNTAFVSSSGLTHKGDKIHFDSASARELGKRFAEAFIRMN